MIYYRGRWLIEPEIKALLTKLENLNKELRSDAYRVLRENAELREKQESDNRQIAEYDDELRKAKKLLKAAVEDIVWLNEHTVDGEGGCLIETSTDMETCLDCPLNVNNSHVCGRKHQDEALALIGEDGDTNG